MLSFKNFKTYNEVSENVKTIGGIFLERKFLRATTPNGPRMVRLGFPTVLKSEEEARPAIIDLLDIAKAVNVGQSGHKE